MKKPVVTFTRKEKAAIRRTIESLNDPETWCQRAFAHDADGAAVLALASDAVKRCAKGWTADEFRDFYFRLIVSLRRNLVRTNDRKGREAAQDLLRKALA